MLDDNGSDTVTSQDRGKWLEMYTHDHRFTDVLETYVNNDTLDDSVETTSPISTTLVPQHSNALNIPWMSVQIRSFWRHLTAGLIQKCILMDTNNSDYEILMALSVQETYVVLHRLCNLFPRADCHH